MRLEVEQGRLGYSETGCAAHLVVACVLAGSEPFAKLKVKPAEW